MKDEALAAFMRPPMDRDLGRLEADVWAGVAAQAAERKLAAVLVACQSGAMALALAGSIVVGNVAVAAGQYRYDGLSLVSGEDLAPSTLLIGR